MGQGGTSSMHPHSPLGDTALPQPWGEHRAPPALVPGKLHGERELPPPPSRPQGHRGGAGPQPLSNSPYCYGQSSRAAGRGSGLRRFGRGDEDMSEAKDPPSEGGLMSLGRGKEGAADSGQLGRWCQQRRGWHRQGGELSSCPRANTVHSRASCPLLNLEPRLNKLITAPAAGPRESYWENWRNK